MFPTISIPKLHNEYQLWMRELIFYKEEIKIFERHLEDVITKNNEQAVAAQVEQFQNQFIREKEVIDELKHKLNSSEKQLADFVKEISGLGLESIKMDNHPNLREDMKTFRNIFNDLKTNFKKFDKRCISNCHDR
ncbi:MAG: hypothetical protein EOO10_03035 [Chitinophagaceae bacterium]|nr:MAG: hypothetical protein EOO10_03035 [Chitinophagaceae bacterium]